MGVIKILFSIMEVEYDKQQDLIAHLGNFFKVKNNYKPRPRFTLTKSTKGNQKYQPGEKLEFTLEYTLTNEC